MADIKYSQAAFNDLEDIGDYISMDLKNPTAAHNTVSRIIDTIEKLEASPYLGSQLSSRYENAGNYRYLVCGNYLVFYRYEEPVVFIDRILYGKRNHLSILFGEVSEDEE